MIRIILAFTYRISSEHNKSQCHIIRSTVSHAQNNIKIKYNQVHNSQTDIVWNLDSYSLPGPVGKENKNAGGEHNCSVGLPILYMHMSLAMPTCHVYACVSAVILFTVICPTSMYRICKSYLSTSGLPTKPLPSWPSQYTS